MDIKGKTKRKAKGEELGNAARNLPALIQGEIQKKVETANTENIRPYVVH